MSKKTPRVKVGISACFFHADPARPIFTGKTLQYVEQSIVHWVQSTGAIALVVPSPEGSTKRGDVMLAEYAQMLDALVLEGGSDMWPGSYGEEPLKPEWKGDQVRDVYETALARAFVEAGKPVLGVCRGLQVLNVAFGGTLYQDIATQMPGAITHRMAQLYDRNLHTIAIAPGTRLAQLYAAMKWQAPQSAKLLPPEVQAALGGLAVGAISIGEGSHDLGVKDKDEALLLATVNSVHHQGIKDLAPFFLVEARCPNDGVIEAIRYDNARGPVKSYVAAVQWHPEFHDWNDPSLLDGAPILNDFLDAARSARHV